MSKQINIRFEVPDSFPQDKFKEMAKHLNTICGEAAKQFLKENEIEGYSQMSVNPKDHPLLAALLKTLVDA